MFYFPVNNIILHSFHMYLSIDIDECEESSLNNCDQLCNNTEGSYRCDCSSGFQLAADHASCEGWYM